MNRYGYIFNDREHAKRFVFGLVLFGVFSLFQDILWQPAFASEFLGYYNFSCAPGTAATPSSNLFYNSDTIAQQMVLVNPAENGTSPTNFQSAQNNTTTITDTTLGSGICSQNLGVFSRVLCFFKSTMGQIMTGMYCYFREALLVPMTRLMTLFVIVYGILVVSGIVDVTIAQTMKTFFKILLIWVFATNSDWAIGVGYRFFMNAAEAGSTMVLSAMNTSMTTGASAQTGAVAATLTQPDSILLSVFNLAGVNPDNPQLPAGLPSGLSGITANYCTAMVVPLVAGLLFAVPPIGIFLIIMVLMYFGLYARSLLGYLTALLLITFLFVLAPLFVSFALFNSTKNIFDRWLQYLATYTAQMTIVFGFLAILQLVPLGTFLINISHMLKEYDTTFHATSITMPIHTCGFCDPGPIDPTTVNLLTTPNATICQATPSTPIPSGDILSKDKQFNVIPVLDILQHQPFIAFMLSQILSLWLIGYVMEGFLKKAPDIAKEMGMISSALVLGGSSQYGNAEPNFIGLQSFEAGFEGFKRQLTKNPFSLNWSRRMLNAGSGFVDGFLSGSLPDSPNSDALEAQGRDAVQRTTSLQDNYAQAQQITVSDWDKLKQSDEEVKRLEKSKASQAAIDAANEKLAVASENFDLAKQNEAQSLADLKSGAQSQQGIFQRIAQNMKPGLLSKSVEGQPVAKGSIEEGLLKMINENPNE